MMLTKGAIGNLINRYSAVLKKCRLMNTFGSLAVASMLVMGGAGVAGAEESVASVGTATEFVAAIKDGSASNINVENDITEGKGVSFNRKVVVDFKGNTYTGYKDSTGSAGTETQLFQFLKESDSVILKNGTLDIASPTEESGKFKMVLQNYCNLTLDNMKIDGTNLLGEKPYAMSNNHGDVSINNSTIIAKDGDVALDVYYWPKNGTNYIDGVSVTVKNSEIDGRIEVLRDNYDYIKEGYKHNLTIKGGKLVGGQHVNGNGGQLATVGTTDISNVVFNGNSATGAGGAIYNAVNNSKGVLTLTDVSFTDNSAAQGGAIYNAEGGTLTLANATFGGNVETEGNKAEEEGGAIYNATNATLTLKGKNTFTGNIAGGNANDIYNDGTMIVADGVTRLESGLKLGGNSKL